MAGAIPMLAQRAGQGRDISAWQVFVVNDKILPPIPSGQQNRPEWRAEGMVGKYVVTHHPFRGKTVDGRGLHLLISIGAERAVSLLI